MATLHPPLKLNISVQPCHYDAPGRAETCCAAAHVFLLLTLTGVYPKGLADGADTAISNAKLPKENLRQMQPQSKA